MPKGYDTIHFWLPEKQVKSCLLTDWRESIKNNGVEFTSGHLDNLRIFSSERGTSIQGSSLKFYHGTNCTTLTLLDTKKAIELISDKLEMSMKNARVTRID